MTACLEKTRFPLSYHQERLWFINQFETGRLYQSTPIYHNIPLLLKVTGLVDLELLRQALQMIIHRHEALRTRIVTSDGTGWQEVVSELTPNLDFADVSSNQADEVWQEIMAAADLAFAEGDTLIRTNWFQIGPDCAYLLVVFHHAICDRQSLAIFCDELERAFALAQERSGKSLSPLPLQYVDFSNWQRSLSVETVEPWLLYWKHQLAGTVKPIQLPLIIPRPAVQTFTAGNHSFRLNSASESPAYSDFKDLGDCEFAVTLACFALLLHRYTDQVEVVVGISSPCRRQQGTEYVIGPFSNLLVIRLYITPSESFRSLVVRTKQTIDDAFENDQLPFDRLVNELKPNADMSRTALFDVLFDFNPVAPRTVKLGEATAKPITLNLGYGKYDISVFVERAGKDVVGGIVYNKEYFPAEFIERFGTHYDFLLASALSNPVDPVRCLRMFSADEERELIDYILFKGSSANSVPLVPANGEQKFDSDYLVHRKFEDAATKYSSRAAVTMNGVSITYQELNARANQVGRWINSLGIGQENQVAVCLERSIDLIVVLLGILKAGASYLPLDPISPSSRLEYLIKDANPKLVLCSDETNRDWRTDGVQIVSLNSKPYLNFSTENLAYDVLTENCAYVIYTSGSTGVPKGVMVSHRNILRLFHSTECDFRFNETDVWSFFHSYGFDFSVWEIWGALLYGGRVVVVPQTIAQSSDEFLDLLIKENVTILNQTPSAFRHLIKAWGQRTGLSHDIRLIIFGGEALDKRSVDEWFKLNPSDLPSLVNMYGITETTVHVTKKKIEKSNLELLGDIGRPISDLKIYLLDSQSNLVPIQVPGEIYVNGAGISRGYFNKPDLTAERFLPDPFASVPGSRMYKTGDQAKRCSSGELQYLGRVDRQVKIRGFRIELGEIESLLVSNPLVREAAVALREDVVDDCRLAAYVVLKDGVISSSSSIAQFVDKQISDWKKLFDQTYLKSDRFIRPGFNISGWFERFRNQPIPEEEMEQWVVDTVSLISSFKPQRVLELGCGSGLILFRLAAICQEYVGTDLSPKALDNIREQIPSMDLGGCKITLHCCPADKLGELKIGLYDCIIINSVIQYFPNAEYLTKVLQGAADLLADGGHIVIGDVRSRSLSSALYSMTGRREFSADESIEGLKKSILSESKRELELLVDPGFFFQLKKKILRITDVRILPKLCHADNELTRYRYQVVLRLGAQAPNIEPIKWLDWQSDNLSIAALSQILNLENMEKFGVTRIPNQRLQRDIQSLKSLADMPSSASVADLNSKIEADLLQGSDPLEIRSLTSGTEYRAYFSLGRLDEKGCFDVVFEKPDTQKENLWHTFPEPKDSDLEKSVNLPMHEKMGRKFSSDLKQYLNERLPPHMVPSSILIISELPMTANGKVDYESLPEPSSDRPEMLNQYVAPRTELEKKLAGIWSRVLRVNQVGVFDNFFALGGHSLLATELMFNIQQEFRLDIPLRALFESPNIASFATHPEFVSDDKKELEDRICGDL